MPLTQGRPAADDVLLQLVLLYAVIRPLGEGRHAAHRVQVWVRVGRRGVQMEVEGAQKRGGRLAAGGGGAAVGDGGVGPLKRGAVIERRHRDGRPCPTLCV